jgi:hypothetical protein
MAFILSTSLNSNAPGYNFSAQVNDSGGGMEPHTAPIPAATAGTMASSTTFTVPTGSVTNGSTIGIFWVAGGILKGALGCTVTGVSAGSPNDTITVSAASATFVAASGSAPVALPSSGAITVSAQYVVDAAFNLPASNASATPNIPGLAIASDQIVCTQFLTSAPASLYVDFRTPVPSEYRYSVSRGDAQPFNGAVASVAVYNSAAAVANWQLVVITST